MLALSHEVHAISFDYGQRHNVELAYAASECDRLKIPHTIIPLAFMRDVSTKSSQTSSTPVPEGFYADSNMRKTVVPNRNMIMLALAAAYAIDNDFENIAYGAHAGDHDIYPDCRAPFINAMSQALKLCDWHDVTLWAPFTAWDKRKIYSWGMVYKLDYTRAWTCYNGRADGVACGRCGSCVERLHAFHDIGKEDPLPYEDKTFYLDAIAKERDLSGEA
jgi:7-cyano-7-deazaguanine synthase